MKRLCRQTSLSILAVVCLAAFLAGCAGEDYTPVYFPPPGSDTQAGGPSPSANAGGRQCTLSFTSQLCVAIKGDKLAVGTDPTSPLCAEVAAFPIHIQGSTVTIQGSEFPDVNVEGHGLPAPITINARGDGDGKSNVGAGTIDDSGNISIDKFSLFIVALGVVGEVPNLKLTTGTTDELPQLPAATGSPADAGGAMTLVTGTVLGHTIDAADKFLKGASLTGSFAGQINPPLSQCGGEGQRSIEVKKLVISADGSRTEAELPDGKKMEISGGTYIAEGPQDVGGRFEAATKFSVKNIGTKPQSIRIPSRKGSFYLSSVDSLTRTLAPQQSFVLDVAFRPTASDTKAGDVIETLAVGADQFELAAKALPKSGAGSVSAVDDGGKVTVPDVGGVAVGDAAVPATSSRSFFQCTPITCGKTKVWTACKACAEPAKDACELLPVSAKGAPVGEVDAKCKQLEPDAAPLLTIDLKGPTGIAVSASKQVLAIRNKGTKPLTIAKITLEDTPGSKSKGQFSIPDGAIFVAKSFAAVQESVSRALAGGKSQGARLPLVLPPYQPGYDETSAYVVVTYGPTDLVGEDGGMAGVGSRTTDKAILRVKTDGGDIETVVTGTTTIREAPALELYFKTSTGVRRVADGQAFSFRGVTPATVDLAVPLFLRVADTSAATLRVTTISLAGNDAANFRWLDTTEKIKAVAPPSGKGMRCSIPVIDSATGQMTNEIFDLKPVPLEPPGFDLAPGAYSIESMPLMGCIDFHRDEGSQAKNLYDAKIVVTAQELTPAGTPAKNPDGSYRQTQLAARLLAAINPLTGKVVMRITQTMAAILNPQFPGLSAIYSREDMLKASGGKKINDVDLPLFTGALILDPFDETSITTSDGKSVVSKPGDGVTAVFRALDTHPISKGFDSEDLFDFANLAYDGSAPVGSRGIYEDYPNVPADAKANGWRIFTGSLSYPGPIAPPERKPDKPSDCLIVNPCSAEGQKMFTDAGVGGGKKGACAFFYATGGRYDSPAFHKAEELAGGEYDKFCNVVDKPQKLLDADAGRYSVDGRIAIEEVGLRFSGPTYFHNPGGPLGPKPPLDEIFDMGFTTGVLKPPAGPDDLNVLPDPKINLSKGEFKINLTDKTIAQPPICENNTKNRIFNGKSYSTWRYLDGLLYKDEEATIPAGCKEEGNSFTGGQAYLRGRDVDPATHTVTLVAGAKFGSSDDLSFAFKDVMLFIVLNGWLCDPMGNEEQFEGKRCFDTTFNDRDAVGQISILK